MNNPTNKEEAIEALVAIFKEKKGLRRLFLSFIKKYKSYGRVEKGISGEVNKPTEQECKDIGNLVGDVFNNSKCIKISAKKIEKEIQQMELFDGLLKEVTLKEVLECYAGETVITFKEEKKQELLERETFFLNLPCNSAIFSTIITWIMDKDNNQNRFFTLYKEDRSFLEKTMNVIDKACALFPLKEELYLPFFSSLVTSDPHFFDINKEEGKLFQYTLQIIEFIHNQTKIEVKLNAEQTTELYYRFGILRDDIWNFTHVFNVKGINKDGSENKLFSGSIEENEMISISLANLLKISVIQAANETNTLYVVENSSLCSKLISELKHQDKKPSLMLSSGQIRIATLKLLDLFVENGGNIYYSGDFDPEGLGIAQKLLYRYKDAITLWRYSVEDYQKAKSDVEFKGKRKTDLQKNIKHPSLLALQKEMLKENKTGYQEAIFNDLLHDLK